MLVRAEGAVKEGMYGNLAGTLTNIVLDPLFILVLGWGGAGAAAATVIGNMVSTCYYISLVIAGIMTAFLIPLLVRLL